MGLKVFGGLRQVGGKQLRTIVAASSQKSAAGLLNISVGFLKDYFPVTSNQIEVVAAMANPGVVLMAADERSKNFSPAEPHAGQ
ncbi:hypothetical protein ACXM5X_32340 [Pseudomonas saponiphila]